MAATFHSRKCASVLAWQGEREDAFALYVVDDQGEAWRIALDNAGEWGMTQVAPSSVPSPGAASCTDLSIGATGIAGETPMHPHGRVLHSFEATTSRRGPAGTVRFEDGSSLTVEMALGDGVCLAWDWGERAEG